MLPSLGRWLHARTTSKSHRDNLANARVHLGRFVTGARVDNEHYMKELGRSGCACGVWEFRVREFTPDQCRIFGVFALPNWFMATHARDRGQLRGDGWRRTIARVEREWEILFPGIPWFTGQAFSDYVTFNGEDRHGA